MQNKLKDQRIPVMMTASEVKAIDDWMFANRLRSRSEAIRQLVAQSLKGIPASGIEAASGRQDATTER
jgi:metal-responsive CopG/Arc/MetJ family transcriptional regulator